MIELVITVEGIDKAQQRLRSINRDRIIRGTKFFIRKRIEESVDRVRSEAPVGETNELASSIQVTAEEKSDTIIANLTATAPHAAWVHGGTGVFGPAGSEIVPKNRLVMTFFKEGKWVRTRKVKGQPANAFLARGARIVRDKIVSTIPQEVRQDIQVLISGGSSA